MSLQTKFWEWRKQRNGKGDMRTHMHMYGKWWMWASGKQTLVWLKLGVRSHLYRFSLNRSCAGVTISKRMPFLTPHKRRDNPRDCTTHLCQPLLAFSISRGHESLFCFLDEHCWAFHDISCWVQHSMRCCWVTSRCSNTSCSLSQSL